MVSPLCSSPRVYCRARCACTGNDNDGLYKLHALHDGLAPGAAPVWTAPLSRERPDGARAGSRAFRIRRVSLSLACRLGGSNVLRAGSRRETTAALNIGVGSSTARVHATEGLALSLGGVVSCARRLSVAAGALVWPRATCKLRSVERDVLCCAKP
jgi:hypothetical protein